MFTKDSNNNMRFDGTRDMVQVFNPYSKKWVDWEQTGKLILPSTITVTTTTLDGEAVTATIGEESHTTTFVDGVAVFRIFSVGTVTITCLEDSITVDVTKEIESLNVELNTEKFYIFSNGAMKNGCEISKGSIIGNTINAEVSNTYYNVYIAIPTSSNLDSKRLYIKAYTKNPQSISVQMIGNKTITNGTTSVALINGSLALDVNQFSTKSFEIKNTDNLIGSISLYFKTISSCLYENIYIA